MPKPLIHIGYPKCLSSWMQRHLFVQDCGMQLVMGPFPLQTSFVSIDPLRFNPQDFLDEYRAACESSTDAAGLIPVCSSENLVGKMSHGAYDAKYLADKLHACFPEARILLVVREQLSLLRSLYKTLVAWGSPHSLTRLLAPESHWRHVAPHFQLEAFEYHHLVDYYHERFGSQQVKLLCYEQFLGEPERFVREVLEHAGVTDAHRAPNSLPFAATVNPGTSLWRLEKHRLSNRLYRNLYNANGIFGETEELQFRRMEKLRRAGGGRLDRWFSPLLERRFDRQMRAAVGDYFGPSNQRLQAMTGIDLAALGYELCD